MRCPRCDTEAAVMSAREEVRDGKCVRVLTFQCRNKRCGEYDHAIGEQTFDKR